MKTEERAQELTIYIGEEDQWNGKPLYAVLIERLIEVGLSGTTVLKGVEGYGVHKKLHSARVELLFQGLPLLITAVDSPEKISAAISAIDELLSEALVTVKDVRAIRYSHAS